MCTGLNEKWALQAPAFEHLVLFGATVCGGCGTFRSWSLSEAVSRGADFLTLCPGAQTLRV